MRMKVKVHFGGFTALRQAIRPTIGAIGLLMVVGAAGTSDTDPSASLTKIFSLATIGMVIAYWGLKPFMGDR